MIEEKTIDAEGSGDYAEKMMGAFLARILHLENLMRSVMSQYFCSDDAQRAALFLSLYTPEMNFKDKVNIFMNMLRICYKDIYETHGSDLKNLYEIDRYRSDLVNLLLSASGQVQTEKCSDCEQSIKPKNETPITGKAAKKEHENNVRLCIKLASLLNKIQRDIISR